MADTIDYDRLSQAIVDALNNAGPSSDATRMAEETNARDQQIKALMRQTKEIKENYGTLNTVGRMFLGQKAAYADVKKSLEALDDQLEKTTKLDERTALIKRRREIEAAAAVQNVSAAFTNTGIAVGKFATTLVESVARASADMLRSIQSGGSSVNIAGNVLKAGVDIVKSGTDAAGTGLQALGTAALASKNAIVKGLGVLSVVGGTILKTAGAYSAELVKFGIDLIGAELNKTIDSFNTAANAGALFANGMTEFRTAAHQAGISVTTLGNIVKNSSEALYASGMNIGAATKKITETFAGAEGRKLKKELFNLGYSMEEQGALVAETMKYMSIAGVNVKNLTGGEIAQATEKYAVNLKAIAAITGEDAKRKMEEARQLTANAAVEAHLASMSAEARQQFMADLAKVPTDLQRAVLQQRVLGTVIDKNAAIMSGVVPGFAQGIAGFAQGLGQGAEVMGRQREQMALTMEQARKNGTMTAIGTVGLVGLAGAASDVSEYHRRLSLEYQKGAKAAGDTATALETLEAMKNTIDPLTNNMSDLQILTGELAATLEQEVTPYLSLFGGFLEEVNNKMIEMIRKAGAYLREKISGEDDTNRPPAPSLMDRAKGALEGAGTGAILGAIGGGLLGIPLGPGGIMAGAAAGAAGGAKLGGAIGGVYGAVKPEYDEYIAKPIGNLVETIKGWFSSNTARNARGGITQAGKLNIAGEAGPEAIVPLETGAIPVKLQMEGFGQPSMDMEFMDLIVDAYDGLYKTTTALQSAVGVGSMSIGEMTTALGKFKDIEPVINNLGNLDQSIINLARSLDNLNLNTVDSLREIAGVSTGKLAPDNQFDFLDQVLEKFSRRTERVQENVARSTTSLIDRPKVLIESEVVAGDKTETLAEQSRQFTQSLQLQMSSLIGDIKSSMDTSAVKPGTTEAATVTTVNENLVATLKNTLLQNNEALKSILEEQNEILRTNTSRIEDLASATSAGADYTRRIYNETA